MVSAVSRKPSRITCRFLDGQQRFSRGGWAVS